jgi:hypothetical protein
MNNFINLTLRVLRWTAISVFVFFASIFVLAFTFDCSMDRLNNRVSVAFIQSVRSDMPIQLLNVDRVVGLNVADFDSVLATGEIYDYDVERDIHIFSEQPDSVMSFHVEMPGVYVVSTAGPQGENEPFILLFDEDWVQQCIANGHAVADDMGIYTTVSGCELDATNSQPVYR